MKRFVSLVGVCGLSFACSSGSVSEGTSGGTGGGPDIGLGTGGTGLGQGGGSGSGSGGTGPSEGNNCGQKTYPLERQPAELLLVLDRSGSMKFNLNNDQQDGVSRWDTVIPAIDDVVKATESGILWGMKTFPNGDDIECHTDNSVVPALKIDNYSPMSSAMKATGPAGKPGTPTRAAVNAATKYLMGRTTSNPKYIVLATDGQPNCADDVHYEGDDDAGAINSVKAAAAAGFNTFVIGVGPDNFNDTLNAMAVEGKQARAGNEKYYSVRARDQLVTALADITGKITNCVFPLATVPPVPGNVAVNLGTTRLKQDTTHTEGWDYGAGMKSIQLYGSACDAVKNGQGKLVDIIYGCPGKLIE